MKKIVLLASAALLLTGCGAVQEQASSKSAFDITLENGSVVQCVQVTGHGGSVAVTCNFEGARP